MALVLDRMPLGTLRVFKRESDGAWLAEGDTNREGIYLYPAEDGSGRMIRELRTADTVRRMTPKIARSVLTMGHPDVEVTPDNVQTLGHGDVDGGFEIVDQGGFVRGRQRVALRTRDALAWAEQAAAKQAAGQTDVAGFSPGYIPIRDNTPGHDPKWGAFDRTLIDVAGVNHLALCGDSYDLPPARGGNDVCALYLDSMPATPAKEAPMKKTKAERDAALRSADAKALIARVFAKDAPSLEELASIVQEAMKDPEGLAALVVHAIVNKPAEVEEIKMGEEPMDEAPMMAAMDARLKAATDALEAKFAPRLAELDALKAKEAARDAASRTANEGAFRTDARKLGIKDAGTLAIDALVNRAAERLALSIDGLASDAALLVVSKTAAKRAADVGTLLPFISDSTTDAVKPAVQGV